MRHSPIRCSLPKRVRSQAPFLRRRYPASPVLRACPPPHSARPVPRGFPVGVSPPPLGLPVLRRTSLYIHAVASTGPLGARVAVFFQRRRPSPANHRVGSRIAVFEACSASLRVTAADRLATLYTGFGISLPNRLKQPLSGGTFTHWIRAFSRRTDSFLLVPRPRVPPQPGYKRNGRRKLCQGTCRQQHSGSEETSL